MSVSQMLAVDQSPGLQQEHLLLLIDVSQS
jgi:hypothetical protein